MELSEYMVKRIKEQPDKFYLILEPEMVNVSFWYIPTRLRKVSHNKQREVELGKVKQLICLFLMLLLTISLLLSYVSFRLRPS